MKEQNKQDVNNVTPSQEMVNRILSTPSQEMVNRILSDESKPNCGCVGCAVKRYVRDNQTLLSDEDKEEFGISIRCVDNLQIVVDDIRGGVNKNHAQPGALTLQEQCHKASVLCNTIGGFPKRAELYARLGSFFGTIGQAVSDADDELRNRKIEATKRNSR